MVGICSSLGLNLNSTCLTVNLFRGAAWDTRYKNYIDNTPALDCNRAHFLRNNILRGDVNIYIYTWNLFVLYFGG